jgi:hypothetical protein
LFQIFVAPETGIYMPGAPFLFVALLIAAILPLAWRMGRAEKARTAA